ncbi:hypothetical protein FOA43_002224 [Brettanomyces nanus]|uniref:Uncharacterized protein n=1 Tax=Eeniella nana TaxID=13502 RepID=A0A875RUS0_EENNA|nr:uncharacterized protein FOA43_002224 [Brettanomyces nanus]QPG74887.1 hypothetical protein FOA43_002224 [Brettanomyces nanus]
MDPSILFENTSQEPFYAERDTLVFALFYENVYKTKKEQVTKLKELEHYLACEIEPFIKYYPWYSKPVEFELYEDYQGRCFIYGELVYGDYVNDLWLITSILYNFSARDSDLYIKVLDQDGEYLLIEGADHISPWMDGEVSCNRIWINDMSIKTVPKEYKEGSSLSMDESLDFIKTHYYKMEPCVDLTDFLVNHVLNKYPKEVLENLYVETVRVNESVFEFIAANKPYLVNAALNFQMESLFPDVPGKKGRFPESFYSDDEETLVDVKVRVSALGYLLLKEYGKRSKLEKGRFLTRSLDKYVSENPMIDIKWESPTSIVEEFNETTDKDLLQKELLRFSIIDREIMSKEPEFESESESEPGEKNTMSPEAEKGQEILQMLEKFMNGGNKEEEEEEEEEVHYDGTPWGNRGQSWEQDNLGSIMTDYDDMNDDYYEKEEEEDIGLGIDVGIDEDDFFEFFCKEALKLKDIDMEKMSGQLEGSQLQKLSNSPKSHRMQHNDSGIDVLSSLFASLNTENGDSGAVSSIVRPNEV